MVVWSSAAQALVAGEPHRLYAQHRVFGGAVVTGNTLMTASIAAPAVNSGLLPRSPGDVVGIPFDAQLEGAYLFWSGSLNGRPDRTIDLTAADGTFYNDVQADRCVTVPALGGFFYCRADVSNLLRDRGGAGRFNGTYFAGDVDAEPGYLNPDGTCVEARECQAKYAAWSLVLVYSSATAPAPQDVFIYDGFRHLDEDQASPGIDRFTISGFDFPEGGRAKLAFFGLEGDSFLGVPPQDTDPLVPCATCFDYLKFGRFKLSNANNPPNNLFNSSSPGGFTLGLDLDQFDVSNLLSPGDSRVQLEAGSGDGVIGGGAARAGGGESFFLGYVMLAVDRDAPNFNRDGTRLRVLPDAGAPGERVAITLEIENEGTRAATRAVAQLALPVGLTYVPGSLRMNGADPVPGDEVDNPLARGLALGNIPFRGANRRTITFLATIDLDARPGSRLPLQAQIRSDELEMPARTNVAAVRVTGALLAGTLLKRVVDLDGDDQFAPGDLVQYLIEIGNPNPRPLRDVRLEDQLPPYLDLIQVLALGGQDVSEPENRLALVTGIEVPPGGTTISLLARIHDAAELAQDGVGPERLDGFEIRNRATVTVAGQPGVTDDPETPEPDATTFRLTAEVSFGGAQTVKRVEDLNGGRVEPGDTLRFTIQVSNSGSAAAQASVLDPLAAILEGCEVLSPPTASCQQNVVSGLFAVPARGRSALVFTARVRADAPHGAVVSNTATIDAVGHVGQRLERSSPPLEVFAAPALTVVEKRVEGVQDGVALPGQQLRYVLRFRNAGNRPAEAVQIVDVLDEALEEIVPEAGGRLVEGPPRQVEWRLGTVAPGAEIELAFAATLAAQLPNDRVVSNQSRLTASYLAAPVLSDDPDTDAPQDPTRFTVRSQPRLVLRKTVEPPSATPGDPVVYTIEIENVGTDVARGVVITDTLPADRFQDLATEDGLIAGNTVRFGAEQAPGLLALGVGERTRVVLTARLAAALPYPEVPILNQASAIAEGLDAPVLSDDPALPGEANPTALAYVTAPALTLTKTATDLNGGDLQPGDRVRYSLRAQVGGDGIFSQPSIRDPLPQGLNMVVNGGARQDGRVWTRTFEGLKGPGDSFEWIFEAEVDADAAEGLQIDNQGRVGVPGFDGPLSDDPATPEPGDPTRLVVRRRADLSLSEKTVRPAGARPGELVSWTITARNSGTVETGEITITDRVPAGLELVDAGGGQLANGVLSWRLPAIAARGQAAVGFTARVIPGVADQTRVENQALVGAAGVPDALTDDPSTPAADDATALVVIARPELRLIKRAEDLDGPPVRPGDVVRYTFEITNTGHAPALLVRVRDALPEGTELVEADAQVQVAGRTLSWAAPRLEVGATERFTISVRPAVGTPNGTVISNQAFVRATGLDETPSDDPTTPEAGDATRIQVVSAADLSTATKTVEDLNGSPSRPGDRVRYTITVRNAGDAVATGLVISDQLPVELTGLTVDGVPVEGPEWRATQPELRPGAERTVVIEGTIAPGTADGTRIVNQAFVSADGVVSPFPTDDPATPTPDATAFVVTAGPDLRISKVAVLEGNARSGGALAYRLTVTNQGDGASVAARLEDPLPAALVDVIAEGGAVSGRVASWPVLSLAPGAFATYALRATVAADVQDGAVISNQARIGEQRSDDPATAAVDDPTVLVVSNRPDLSRSTKIVRGTFEPGAPIEYELRITNSGPRAAQQVVVTDALPPGLTFVAANPPARPTDAGLVFELGEIPGDSVRTITIQAAILDIAPDGLVIANQGQITSRDGPLVLTDDPSTPEPADPTRLTVVARPILSLNKTVRDDNGGSFAPGDPISYVLTVTNEGNRRARGVQITDDGLDPRLQQLVAVDGALIPGGAQWAIADLPAGEAVTVELHGRVPAEIGNGSRFENTAWVGMGDARLAEAAAAFEVRFDGLGTSAKTVRSLDPRGFVPGAEVEYQIVLTNRTDAAIENVAVSDPLPDGRLEDIRALDGGDYRADRQELSWVSPGAPALARIEPGDAVTLRFQARISRALRPGDTVDNQAIVSVRGDPALRLTDDPTTPEPLDATRLTVVGGPVFDVQKQIVAPRLAAIEAGTEITYEIQVINRGTATSTRPVLTDPLPAQLRYVQGSTSLNGQRVPDRAGAPRFGAGLDLALELAPNEAATVQFKATVRDGTQPGSVVSNQAFVMDSRGFQAPSDDPTTPAANDPTAFEVTGTAFIGRFVKTFQVVGRDTERAVVGDTIEWTLLVRNGGEARLRSVSIEDPLPAGATYVPGSLSLDGQPLTDRRDGDPGLLAGDRIGVQLDVLEPGRPRRIKFRTIADVGPTIQNQARALVRGRPALPSDDDGDLSNGRGPTVVTVGAAPVRAFSISKTVADLDGAPTYAGETLRYTFAVTNDGTVDLAGIEVADDLPKGLIFDRAPPGVRVRFVAAPEGAFGNGRLVFEDIAVAAGERIEWTIDLRTDPALTEDLAICNTAKATALSVPEATTEPACVTVVARKGALRGVAFQDRDGDGRFSGEDLSFEDMRVLVTSMADPDAPPLLRALTDAEGRYRLSDLVPGRYRLRLMSRTDALLAVRDNIEVAPGRALTADLVIDPSGRVYDSVEGDLIDGAEVFIYRDEDTNADPLDESSRQRRVLVPPEDLLGASQQGQRTAHGGLYRFDVKRPGRYLIEVVPPGESYVSPSVLVPVTPGVAFTDGADGKVVENDLPSVEPDADRTWFLAFELNGPDDGIFNNHIPIDPLTSLIDLEKRALRPTAQIGEVVSYRIDVVNRSPNDLLFDPATGTGGVYIQDILPKGFKYVAGSVVLSRISGSKRTALSADDPPADQVRILRFGQTRIEGGKKISRPMDLHAGESLRLTYQAAVGAQARPNRKYVNRAMLVAEGNVPISRTATATVRVLADPEFDQGLLLGRVFCDDDEDGVLGPDEPGLAGVRVFIETGVYAVTDSSGLFHFKAIDPGTHAIKVDASTMLPGARFTTDQTRVMSFTRGLPVKMSFGVTCPAEQISGAQVELSSAGSGAALATLRGKHVVVVGNTKRLVASARGMHFVAPQIKIALRVDGKPAQAPDLKARLGGAIGALSFAVTAPANAPGVGWRLLVGPVGGGEITVKEGRGSAPSVIEWDQRDLTGAPVLKRGASYTYRIELIGGAGQRSGSPAGVFGVGRTAAVRPALLLSLPSTSGAKRRLAKAQADALREAKSTLAGEFSILVEGHGDDRSTVESTQAEAQRVATFLIKRLGVDPKRLTVVGRAGTAPLVPNFSGRNRRRNSRVELRKAASDEALVTAVADKPGFAPVVRIGRFEVAPDAEGDFALVGDIPPDGVIEVYLRDADGRQAVVPIELRIGAAASEGAPVPLSVEGVLPKALSVGGVPLVVPEIGLEITGPAQVAVVDGALERPARFALKAAAGALDWRVVVLSAEGKSTLSEAGRGAPPPVLEWAGEAAEGLYQIYFTAWFADGTVRQAAPLQVRVGAGAKPAAPASGPWTLRVDGQPVVAKAGRNFARVVLHGDERLLLEITSPAGATVAQFVGKPDAKAAVPTGAEAKTQSPPAPLPAPLPAPPPYAGLGARPGAIFDGPADAALKPLAAEQRARLVAFGREQLAALLKKGAASGPADAQAAQLSVRVPPRGATLAGPTVPISGSTHPDNRVFINGAEVGVDGQGRFGGAAAVPPGATQIEIVAVDAAGNRGVIRHPIVAPDAGYFLLAFAESLAGQQGAELDGVTPTTTTNVGDSIYLHGRAAAYFKGYTKGDALLGGLFKRYEATAHIDTARRKEYQTYFRQLIDPDRFYPTYGDSALEVNDVNTRGPVYVLLKADDSRFEAGNFKLALRGVELFRYDRTLYGAKAALDIKTGKLRHEITAFGADLDQPERHAYVELAGTGGSLFYLPHRELVEGSERVALIERDQITGLEIRRRVLARDQDYTVRYADGRLLTMSPVPIAAFDGFGALPQPNAAGVKTGHPVYLSVEYDHRDIGAFGETASGIRVQETWNDAISVGAGYLREGRANAGQPNYKLWGADFKARHGRRTHFAAEFARSQSINGQNLFSLDGGLSFSAFNSRDGATARGSSFLLRGGLELDDLVGQTGTDRWFSEAYYQYLAPGFYSGSTIQQQGQEKYGVATRYRLDERNQLWLRHDGLTAEDPARQEATWFRSNSRRMTRVGHTYQADKLRLDSELAHLIEDRGDDQGVYTTDTVKLEALYKLDDSWSILAGQEVVAIGDARIHKGFGDLMTSTVGGRWKPSKTLNVELTETLRWSGDNATQIGVRTEIDERHTLYAQERFSQLRGGPATSTSVIGGEEKWGGDRGGRAYGEYQLETGGLGARNRAVLGLGRRAKVIEHLTIDAAYERSQVLGGAAGAFSQDAISLGVEWLDKDFVKVSGRYELRQEDNDEDFGRRDRAQWLALNGISLKLHPDLTLLIRLNYSRTEDVILEMTEAELLEGSVGLAWRPIHTDWIAIISRYTRRYEQRPTDLLVELPEQEQSDVFSVMPIFELPFRFQLVEKLAWKRFALRADMMPAVVGQTFLWINRLNYHLTNTWDAGFEYRYLSTSLAQDSLSGTLVEVDYIVKKTVRIGVGYNFTSFSDDEFARLDEDRSGPFFRVTAQY